VSKLKGERMFQLNYTCSNTLFAFFLPLALSIFPSPLSVTLLELGVTLRPPCKSTRRYNQQTDIDDGKNYPLCLSSEPYTCIQALPLIYLRV
jgi:hypothetical protein